MTHRHPTISFLGAALLAMLLVGSAVAAEKKEELVPTIDFEGGFGAFISLGSASKAPLEDGWHGRVGAAFHITDRLDAELGLGVGQADRNQDGGSNRTFVNGHGGLRYYVLGVEALARSRMYLMLGGSAIENYASSGNTKGTVYLGPGVRLRAGDRSGLNIRLPFYLTPYDIDESLVIPTVNIFYSF